jgi:hypothetical protein
MLWNTSPLISGAAVAARCRSSALTGGIVCLSQYRMFSGDGVNDWLWSIAACKAECPLLMIKNLALSVRRGSGAVSRPLVTPMSAYRDQPTDSGQSSMSPGTNWGMHKPRLSKQAALSEKHIAAFIQNRWVLPHLLIRPKRIGTAFLPPHAVHTHCIS